VGGGCLRLHGELLEGKLVADDVEGGEGHDPLDESFQVAVAGAEATQKVQYKGTVGNGLAEVVERVRHALHLAVVLAHGEVLLREQVELRVEVECPSLSVPEELLLEGKSSLMGYQRGRTATEEEALHVGHLGGQGDAHGMLLLQGKCRGTLVLVRGGGGRLDGGDGRDQRKRRAWSSTRTRQCRLTQAR
jgi:hypothetical protein